MDQGVGVDLRKLVVPECVFGSGARFLAARYATNLGARKVLVVTDPGVISAGWTTDIIDGLKSFGVDYTIFDSVTPNPKADEVMFGTEVYLSENCNSIITIGGGSPMDCAKGIGIVSTSHRPISEFEGVDEVRAPIPPLICVPTTGGGSADVSQFAIITDPKRHAKFTIISKTIVPDVSLNDPVTLTTMPYDLTADTGFDVITHAFEAYVSNAQSAVTDLFALESLRLVSRNLLASLADPLNIGLRSNMAVASLDAGIAFSNAGLGIVHAMSHSLGGLISAPHGAVNAILLRQGVSFNFPVAGERYRKIGEAMGLNLAGKGSREVESALIGELDRLQEAMGFTKRLSDVGVSPDDIPELARMTMDDPNMATNPREPSLQDVEEIYARAL